MKRIGLSNRVKLAGADLVMLVNFQQFHFFLTYFWTSAFYCLLVETLPNTFRTKLRPLRCLPYSRTSISCKSRLTCSDGRDTRRGATFAFVKLLCKRESFKTVHFSVLFQPCEPPYCLQVGCCPSGIAVSLSSTSPS